MYQLIIVALSMIFISFAQASDQEILSIAKKHNFQSGVIQIVKNRKIIFNQAFSYDFKANSITVDTAFPIASLTKQFTAACLFKLQEEEIIDLAKPISFYLPKDHIIWKYFDCPPHWIDTTSVYSLLNHSSGIVDYYPIIEGKKEEYEIQNLAQILSIIKNKPLHEAGVFHYSNSNYLLAAAILETVTKSSLQEYFLNNIFKLLDLEHTHLPYGNSSVLFPKRYVRDVGNHIVPATKQNAYNSGDGGVISTVSDLNKWQEALYNYKFITKSSLEQMTQALINFDHPQFGKTGVAYGLFVIKLANYKIFRHGGAEPGVRSELWYGIDDQNNNISIAILSNLSPQKADQEYIRYLAHDLMKFSILHAK